MEETTVKITVLTPPTFWLSTENEGWLILAPNSQFDNIIDSINTENDSILINHLDDENSITLTNEIVSWTDYQIKHNDNIVFFPYDNVELNSWIMFSLGANARYKNVIFWNMSEEVQNLPLMRGILSYFK